MPRQACPHYPQPTSTAGVSRCRACGVIMGVAPTDEAPVAAQYPGTPAAAGTTINAAKATNMGVLATHKSVT